MDYLQGGRETSFILRSMSKSAPCLDVQISLKKAVNALCSEGIQICQDYLSTLPLHMFCFDDSKVSLGVRRTQACLLTLTPEGKSFLKLLFCIIMNPGFKFFSSASYISRRILYAASLHKTDGSTMTLSEMRWRWCCHEQRLLLSPFPSISLS